MEILAKHEVCRFGRYFVMEGPVRTPDQQEVSLYWVEDTTGSPVTSFTCEDVAVDLAVRLSEYDFADDLDEEEPDDVEESGPHRLH
ncbi:hypothetical protein [Noviherbaspirillum aridicola]|uniref:Uncharacterized protein n=1 Tax=Noviherbaspirillum aridicola TaxID=2849687 RepID=A0ABQ4Q9P9_9BURK|nr:hypothetical protein [Noviherbaspirillum aridicola]GIZ53943.1 hypothetical protein NCCP691_39570 [Noviherbaspirillum aridicola]